MNEITYKPLRLTEDKSTSENQLFIPSYTRSCKKISTLFVSDLPFTAHAAIDGKIPVIGYKGIADQNSESLKILDPGFLALLRDKKVHTVVLLYNSDVVDPKFKPGNETDLTKSLFNIYYAVKKFREQLSSFDMDITLFFANIAHRFHFEEITTFDALFAKDKEKVTASLLKYNAKTNSCFDCINLTEFSLNRLYDHLKLKDAISFYSYHASVLKQYEFTFKSVKYCHDGEKLEKIQYTDSKLYLRVGPYYYKRVMIMNAHDEYEEVLKPWHIGEINRDYGKEFIREINRYDSFVNKPNNSGEYQRIINSNHNGVVSNLYNIYHPVDWEPVSGDWSTIGRFLKHIFSACNLDGEVLYEFGLDYIQLSYLFPRQRLPILALVSSERNTGKSTFLDFLKLIFGANMSILDNQRFNPRFTSHFAGKLFVAIDEGHIPLQDKMNKEMIKNMATGKVMWLEGKGSNAEMVENFTHLLFCSNDERNFMQIDPGENRFAVLKVPSYRKNGEKDDPDLLEKMRVEIPGFLNYLQNRRLHYPVKTTRFWFPDHVYVTEALQTVMDRTKSTIEKELEDWLSDSFHNFRQIELNYTLDDVTRELNRAAEVKFPKSKIKELLAEKYNIKPGESLRYVCFSVDVKGETVEQKKKGRYCTFYAQNWLTPEEYSDMFSEGHKEQG